MAQQFTIACLDGMIWTLGLSLAASCIGCNMHHEHVSACYCGIPLSSVWRDLCGRKTSYRGSVMQCRYCITSFMSCSIGKGYYLLLHDVRSVAWTSLLHYCQSARESELLHCHQTSFASVWIIKNCVSWIYNVIIMWWIRSLFGTCPHSYKGPIRINTYLSPLASRADRWEDSQK